MKRLIIILWFCFKCFAVFAQSDSLSALSINAYAEVYFGSDFNQIKGNQKPDFLYNHKKSESLSLNLAFLKAKYSKPNFRWNLALMLGDYARNNLNHEPIAARYIFESNIGIKVSKNKDIWIDAGILPSHIGFESAIGADCMTLTRSLLAENSPYYESGIKFSHNTSKFFYALLFLNGWQKINFQDFRPAIGVQVAIRPSEKVLFNYSNFLGSQRVGSLNALRSFHNFYGQFSLKSNFQMIVGLDVGIQKTTFSKSSIWYSPVIISQLKISDKHSLSGRAELYSDKNQVMIYTQPLNGFQTFGYSINYDYLLNNHFIFRIEGKQYYSKKAIFEVGNGRSSKNKNILGALIVRI